jgi:GTP-binding protein EngB required for normal cell division
VLFPLNVALGEDNNFNVHYLLNSRAVRMIDVPLYHYLRHPKQSSRRCYDNYFEAMTANFTMIEALIDRYHGFEDKDCLERHFYEFFRVLEHTFYHVAGHPELTWREKNLKIQACLNDRRSRRVIANVNVTRMLDRVVLFLMKRKLRREILLLFGVLSLRLKVLQR